MPATPASRDDDIRAFFRLVATGPVEDIQRTVRLDAALVHAVGPHPFWGGRPQALHVAIERRRRDVVDLLLAAGANPDGANDAYGGWSPLMLAIGRNLDDVRDALVRNGARIGLVEALMLGDDALTYEWLAAGAAALPRTVPNAASLVAFARTTSAIDRLLELGVRADVADCWGTTPIQSFSRLGDRGRELVGHLVSRGIDAPPEVWARLGDLEALAACCSRDPAIASDDAVIFAAVQGGHQEMVRWLLANGASVHARSPERSRHTALHEAAWNGDLPMVTLLLGAGADRSARDDEHDATPQDWAQFAIGATGNPRCAHVVSYLSGTAGSP